MAKDNMLATNFVVELIAAALERRTVLKLLNNILNFPIFKKKRKRNYGSGSPSVMTLLVKFLRLVRYNNSL